MLIVLGAQTKVAGKVSVLQNIFLGDTIAKTRSVINDTYNGNRREGSPYARVRFYQSTIIPYEMLYEYTWLNVGRSKPSVM